MKPTLYLICLLFFLGCGTGETSASLAADLEGRDQTSQQDNYVYEKLPDAPFLTVLGIAQDAGYPQANCQKECCEAVWLGEQEVKLVSCLAVVDPNSGAAYLFDATPDFKLQWQRIVEMPLQQPVQLSGIFLTHAHIGHYTGLMHLGREVMGTKGIPVYTMPRMENYLETNGPWSQLIKLNNIDLQLLQNDSTIQLDNQLKVTPLQVPHRDEFSETVGYRIEGKNKKVLFIPDIDKWQKWNKDINAEIQKVDRAYLDGSFFQNGELPNRDMSEIPHPFVEESMKLFSGLSPNDKSKVRFIHFNHTNPLLRKGSNAQQQLISAGYFVAEEGEVFEL